MWDQALLRLFVNILLISGFRVHNLVVNFTLSCAWCLDLFSEMRRLFTDINSCSAKVLSGFPLASISWKVPYLQCDDPSNRIKKYRGKNAAFCGGASIVANTSF